MANVSAEPPADWRAASQLLQAGEYQQVADLLQTLQGRAQVDNPLLALLVGSVEQICLACWQCHADREWHQQASSAAQQREEILRRQAQSILTGISAHAEAEPTTAGVTIEPSPITPAAPIARPNRWSQVRGLLDQVKHLFAAEEETPAPLLPEEQPEPPPAPVELTVVTLPPAVVESGEPSLPVAPAWPVTPAPVEESDEPVLPALPATEAPAETSSAAALPAQPLSPAMEPPTELVIPEPAPPRQPLHDLMICCLGSFRVYQQDQLIDEWNGLKGQMILKYLAVHRNAPVAKDVLMEVFWPDTEPEAARRNLHQAIYSLRQTLRRRNPTIQHIDFENNQYLLNSELSVWVDSDEFATQVQTGRRLETAGQVVQAMAAYGRAEALYQGDFLAEDPYEEWPRGQRDRLRSSYLEIADHLSEYYLQQGEHAAASALCHKILTLDNCFEAAHRRLMRCYLAQGQRHLAIRQYHTCVQALASELDVPPDDETRRLYESITNGA